jgi:hypothetical protein
MASVERVLAGERAERCDSASTPGGLFTVVAVFLPTPGN